MGRKTKLWQRWLSLVLAIYMGLSNVPLGALAQEPEENPWEGRSAVFVGDSITAGTGTTKIYYEYLEEALGLDPVTAMGVGGSCISAASDYGQNNQPLINRYQNIPSADLIMIFMGTNDYGHETPLGTLEDTQDGTFCGALNTVVSYLVAKHPSGKLVFVTPLHRYGFGTSKILGAKFTYDHIPNGVGATLGDYVNAVKTVCAKNGVSVVDLYTECTLDPTDAAVREQYMPDGLHPNAAGHEVVAGILETHIRSFKPMEKEPVELPEMVQGNKFAAGNNQPCRASSRVNYYLKAGTVITLKDPAAMQWACAKTSDENSSNNLGYFPEKQWTDIETAVVAEDGWVGFTFKYRDETRSFDLTKPLSDFITITEPFSGKKVSILSHSMSTYAGVSNNTSYNSTIGSNDVYYTEGRHGVYREDTWWQQAIDALGMELLVNNSWSGSCIFQPRKGEASVGYGDRAVNLHNDHTGEEPDIIWVYLGGNDFAYYQDTFGKAADVDYAALIRENTDGTFTYAAPTTACEAYAIMLHKVHNRYPDADIYCMTSTARRDPDYTGDSYPDAGQPTAFMAELHKVADKFGFPVVDLETVIPKEAAEFDKYIADKRAHCNALGMDKITNALLSVMLGKESEIRHVTSGNGTVAEQAVLLGGSYGARVTVPEGHTLSVTMDGEDITEEAFSNGSIYIANVTGDIAVALKRGAESFRWEMQNDALVSTGETENALTLLSGTVTDGVLEDARFSLTTPVELYHDRPWVVEWKYTEDWRGVVLSSEPAKLTPGRCYLTRTKGGQLCFGSWDGTQYHNYGVDLSNLDAKAHTYRLENRIADDGSNMVYLYLDGAEIGPMNHYFIGSKDQNSTDDWLSGKDFVLPYIGSDSTPLDNCAFQFLAVWEDGHSHDYKEVVTAPTCTEKGYTTHTCICGDSYVDSYTDPRPLNILMIGNSFSWDAADFWYDMQTSMTYDAMKAMLAEPYDAHLAVMYKGSATLAYHATCAMNNTAGYTYTEIGPETGYQWTPSSGKNADNNILDQLEARDWDIIVIQSYQHEADGTEPRSTYTGGDARFAEPKDSLGYLLDYFDGHEPGAKVYYYMPWATTKFYGNDGLENGYLGIAQYAQTHIPNMTGTESGKRLAGIIPVGTGIQNARTTYLGGLNFTSGTGSTALLKDPQNGLQYDTQHLSFGVGRYIAGVIVAESLIPREMRRDSYTLPAIKASPSVGMLPEEYTAVARLAAQNALSQPYKVTELTGYDQDPAERVCDAIETADYSAGGIADEAALKAYMETVVAEGLKDMGAAESAVTIQSFTLTDGKIAAMEATVTLRVGYTSSTAKISVTDGKAHRFGEWEQVSVPSAEGPGLNRRVCETCGFVDEQIMEGSWQKYALADHLQQLPETFCSETNLWNLLEPESVMIDHLGNWVSAGATVYSVTIPVSPGDKIYANSFDQTDSRKGIQVSFIGDYGIVKTTFSSGTYQEFHANGGYLVAPEGAIAVNIPVWNVNAENNTIHIQGYDHVYESVVTAPTCTEKGYTTHTCATCGDSFVDSYVDIIWHDYAEGQCSMCGCDMLRITTANIVPYQGGVNSEDGTLNTTFTNNWYTDIPIPGGAEQVRVLTFKTGGRWGSAFYNETAYLSGFCDPDVGGQWVTVDVPETATLLRYGYLYDAIAQKNNWPVFQYLEFAGEELGEWEGPADTGRPATGCHSFSVEVNIAPAQGDPDGYIPGRDYGYIMLPTNYDDDGEPTRLIIVCHGATAKLADYQSDAWKTHNYSFWTDLGYAVMDMYACPEELAGGSELHYGNPVVLECYKKGYDYVMERFNLKQDGIFVIGSSMGGLSSFQIVQSGLFPVLAQVGYCPAIDLFKQAYCNPWTTASYQRSRIASYFGFSGTAPAFTNSKYPSEAEIEFYRQNLDKTIPYSPILRNVVDGDVTGIFDKIPASATATDTAEAALYAQLTATHPCPLMIFHNTDDSTVSYRYSQYFVDMVNRSGQNAILRTFTSGGHNAMANGENVTVQGTNRTITIKESQYEAYLFFSQLEQHEAHYPWVDPAVDATCTETGLTEGKHCAVCGEVLVKQESVPATGHSYEYAVETAPTLTAAGKLKGICEVCSGTTTVELPKLDEVAYDYAVTAGPTYTETGLATYTWKETAYGTYTFEVVLETLPILYGDVNGDGTVNNKDRLVLTRYLAKWTDYPEEIINMAAADVNGDGKVNNLDRLILTRYLAKWTGYETLPYKQ